MDFSLKNQEKKRTFKGKTIKPFLNCVSLAKDKPDSTHRAQKPAWTGKSLPKQDDEQCIS